MLIAAGAAVFDALRHGVILHPCLLYTSIALADMDVEILLLLERGDFPVALHQHCNGRRLDAPNHQLLVICLLYTSIGYEEA